MSDLVGERIKYLEEEINRMCDLGEFSDELLEFMAELEELQNNPGSYQPEDCQGELDGSEQESTSWQDYEDSYGSTDRSLECLVNEFNVRVGNTKQDYIRLDFIYTRGKELGLTTEDIQHAVTLIIKHARKRYNCYVLPQGGFKGYDLTKDLWENLKTDIIVFDNQPLEFKLSDWEGELPVRLLAAWSNIGFKFVVAK